MIILASTSDKIEVALEYAVTVNEMRCFASFRDTTVGAITPKRSVTDTTGAVNVTLVSSPAASTQRVIDYLSVYNSDTVINVVTVKYTDGVNVHRLMVTRLAPGEKLEYQEGEGFRVISNGYAEKTVISFDGLTETSDLTTVVLKNDYNNQPSSPNALIDAINLSMPVKAGKKYWFRFILFYDVDAIGTGSRWNIYGVSATGYAFVHYQTRWSTGAVSETAPSGLSTYLAQLTSSVNSAAIVGNFATIEGFVQPDFDGIVYPVFGCELSGARVTLNKNSLLQYKQTI